MKALTIFLVISASFSSLLTKAQDIEVLQGYVLELNSSEPMQNVRIKNLISGEEVYSDSQGKFSIQVKMNQRLQLEYTGYRTDTLVVTSNEIKRLYMTPDNDHIMIDAVSITAMTDSRLQMEIDKAKKEGKISEYSIRRGGIRISPSRMFGREAKRARQRHELLIAERERREIDQRFSTVLIQQLTPLTGNDLVAFQHKYRPTLEFIQSANGEALKIYILDSYAHFNQLSEEERNAIHLSIQIP